MDVKKCSVQFPRSVHFKDLRLEQLLVWRKMPFRKSCTLVGVLDSGKSEEKVEVMTELAE